ncbi:hypothetical protein C8Q74DRAFT_1283586 [Fomes fomentarius]|nr:hypothetical protein C8Q74DRAFT_1283586 [Fomes fomentarius]
MLKTCADTRVLITMAEPVCTLLRLCSLALLCQEPIHHASFPGLRYYARGYLCKLSEDHSPSESKYCLSFATEQTSGSPERPLLDVRFFSPSSPLRSMPQFLNIIDHPIPSKETYEALGHNLTSTPCYITPYTSIIRAFIDARTSYPRKEAYPVKPSSRTAPDRPPPPYMMVFIKKPQLETAPVRFLRSGIIPRAASAASRPVSSPSYPQSRNGETLPHFACSRRPSPSWRLRLNSSSSTDRNRCRIMLIGEAQTSLPC